MFDARIIERVLYNRKSMDIMIIIDLYLCIGWFAVGCSVWWVTALPRGVDCKAIRPVCIHGKLFPRGNYSAPQPAAARPYLRVTASPRSTVAESPSVSLLEEGVAKVRPGLLRHTKRKKYDFSFSRRNNDLLSLLLAAHPCAARGCRKATAFATASGKGGRKPPLAKGGLEG